MGRIFLSAGRGLPAVIVAIFLAVPYWKKHLNVEQLLNLFSQASGSDEADDKLLLSK